MNSKGVAKSSDHEYNDLFTFTILYQLKVDKAKVKGDLISI